MARRRFRTTTVEEEVPGVTSLQPLAAGGNSTVYRAWQPELDRWVAVKVLGVTLSEARARERFLRECSAVGRLTGHPSIVTVLASGVTRSDRPFLTMDLFERGSLADLVAGSGPVSVELALRYGVKLAGALETAHRAGILHRDLKPENVLLSRFGEPGLADFGIATLGEARGGTEAFTATHAAPEVLDGRQATAAADVYGLGSTLWTALSGRLPFGDGAEGPLKLMLRVMQEPLPPLGRPDVPAAVEEALQWAMAKEPEDRAPTAAIFGERLRSLQAELDLPVSDLVVPDDLEHLTAPEGAGSGSSAERDGPPAPPAVRPAEPTIRPRRVARHGADALASGAELASPGASPPAGPADAPSTSGSGPGPAGWTPPMAADPAPGGGAVEDIAARNGSWRQAHPGAEPVAGALPEPDLSATIVRPRAPAVPSADPGAPARRPTPVAMAIVAGAIVLALAIVVGAILATRNGGAPTPSSPSIPSTSAAGGPGAPSTGAVPTTTAAPALPPRAATGVAVRVVDPLSVVVTWKAPPERSGLIGYVVAHAALKAVNPPLLTQAVNDPNAVEASVVLAAPGPRCFVVQSIYTSGQGTTSEPACT